MTNPEMTKKQATPLRPWSGSHNSHDGSDSWRTVAWGELLNRWNTSTLTAATPRSASSSSNRPAAADRVPFWLTGALSPTMGEHEGFRVPPQWNPGMAFQLGSSWKASVPRIVRAVNSGITTWASSCSQLAT